MSRSLRNIQKWAGLFVSRLSLRLAVESPEDQKATVDEKGRLRACPNAQEEQQFECVRVSFALSALQYVYFTLNRFFYPST